MEKTITYLGIEKITYKFNESDILRILLESQKISGFYDSTINKFEIFENDDGYYTAVITVNIAKKAEDDNP